MKTSSMKAKGRCRRCKKQYKRKGRERICSSCRSKCVGCGTILTPENVNKAGLKRNQYYCNLCTSTRVKETRGNKGFCQESYDLKRHYGITKEERDSLFKDGCEVCGSYDKLCVDHDHNTGAVRGCLCSRCNTGLGMFNDSKRNLEKAIRYLNCSEAE